MNPRSLTDLFRSSLGLGQNVLLQENESQGRSFVLSGIAQHVVEGVLHHLGVLTVAGFLGQDSGEGCDGVESLASQDLVQADAVESLGTAPTAQDAFSLPHQFEPSLLVSSGVGSVHAFHVLLLWGHKPFAVGRSIDPIRLACRSCNYPSAWRRDRQVCKGGATPKSLAEGPLRENR